MVSRYVKDAHWIKTIFVVRSFVRLASNQRVIPLCVAVSVHVNDVPTGAEIMNQMELTQCLLYHIEPYTNACYLLVT